MLHQHITDTPCHIRMDRVEMLGRTLTALVHELAREDDLTLCEVMEASTYFMSMLMLTAQRKGMELGHVVNITEVVTSDIPTRIQEHLTKLWEQHRQATQAN